MNRPHSTRRTAHALAVLSLACLILLLIPTALHGQETGRHLHALSLGVRGSVGTGGITIRPYQPSQSALLFDVGVRGALHSSRHMAMVVELNYRRTGYTSTYPTPHSASSANPEASLYMAQQEWLTLPLLLEGRFHIGPVSINATVGPEGDFLLTERAGPSGALVKQTLYTNLYQRLGVSILGGIGLGVNTRAGSFVVEYRTFYRLSNLYVLAEQPKLDSPRSNLRGQTVSLSYYYTFTFGNQP